MSNKVYAFDEYGNKHETMKKDEIEQSIGAGGVRECVLTGCINYNKVDINFNYTGTLPSDISKLLAFGVDPENNKLTEAEVTNYLSLGMFSIHFYYLDAEIYVTNVNGTYLAYSKMGEGTFNVYPRKVEKFYFVKADEKTTSGEYVVATAVNSTYAQYASEDKTKGTIEERLNNLGFKEGTFTIASGSASRNEIKKQGKVVWANFEANSDNTIIRVPTEFRPKENTWLIIGVYSVIGLIIGQMVLKTDGKFYDSDDNEIKWTNLSFLAWNSSWEIA